jgi:hypothetical protein
LARLHPPSGPVRITRAEFRSNDGRAALEESMNRLTMLLAAPAALALAVPAAAAQYIFSFGTSTPLFGPTVSGSGTFTTSDTATTVGGQTAFQILSIAGTVNGLAINAPTGNYGNYFTTGPSFLDGTGTVFSLVGGGRVDFFNQSSNGLYRVNTFSPGSSNFVNASSSIAEAVPEPATWAMMLLGFAGIGFAMRRGRRHSARLLQLA